MITITADNNDKNNNKVDKKNYNNTCNKKNKRNAGVFTKNQSQSTLVRSTRVGKGY